MTKKSSLHAIGLQSENGVEFRILSAFYFNKEGTELH